MYGQIPFPPRRPGAAPPSSDGESPRPEGGGGATPQSRPIGDRELRLTAALYAQIRRIMEHVRATGELPPGNRPIGGGHIGLRLIIERRGTDITLTPDEQLVYDAIRRARRLPFGSAALVEEEAMHGS